MEKLEMAPFGTIDEHIPNIIVHPERVVFDRFNRTNYMQQLINSHLFMRIMFELDFVQRSGENPSFIAQVGFWNEKVLSSGVRPNYEAMVTAVTTTWTMEKRGGSIWRSKESPGIVSSRRS